jgi:hypothetical protein
MTSSQFGALDPIRRLKEIARDAKQIPLEVFRKEMHKVFLISINTYTSYDMNIGSGPFEDAFQLARIVKLSGYQIFYIHNPHAATFLDYFDKFLSLTTSHLIFLYVGRGTSVADVSGDEADGFDEALVYDDANIIDDVLVTHLVNHKNPGSQITLLTDARHKDVIWNMCEKAEDGRPIPPGVRSLSAERRWQTVTKTLDEDVRVEKGTFVHAITEALRRDPKATPRSLQELVTDRMREVGQAYTFGTTSPGLLDEPLLI